MSDPSTSESSATSIWNSRYQDGEISVTRVSDDTDPIDYTQHAFLNRNLVNKALTGVASNESRQFLMKSIFSLVTPEKVLAVGSGLGIEEQSLIEDDTVQKIEAYELSDVAVEKAKARIHKLGLSDRLVMHAGDVTKAGLAKDSFDAIYVSAAIHHFFNIEEMMDFFYSVLKPGGILVYNEYVGPDHHMYHDDVMAVCDRINRCLDESLRFDVLRNEIRSFVPRATLEWMLEMDPSEGVHSSKILPLTYQKFDVVQRFDYGGTLMRPFWVGILRNFDFSDYKDQTIARLIGLIEELLIETGQIPNYHTIVAARKGVQDPEKPLIDNEMLTYQTHGQDLETLIGSIFKKENVISCLNFTDENWQAGVIRSGPIRLLLPGSPAVRKALENAKRIVVDFEKTAKVESVEPAGEKLVLNCIEENFDRSALHAPAQFWVT